MIVFRNLSLLIAIVLTCTGSSALWNEVVVQGNWNTKYAMGCAMLAMSGLLIWLTAIIMDRGDK